MKPIPVIILWFGAAFLFAAGPLDLPAQIFVKKDASGANDGSSWTDAYTDLQMALEDTTAGEIWVAAGIYHPGGREPDTGSVFLIDRSGISLYGGFAGTEKRREARDPVTHLTILSGDLLENDLPGDLTQNREDNVRQLLRIPDGVVGLTRIDGFVIESGQQKDLYVAGVGVAAGIFSGSDLLISRCRFQHHSGIVLRVAGANTVKLTIDRTDFLNNLTFETVWLDDMADIFIRECTFRDNFRGPKEPVISLLVYTAGSLQLENCRWQNSGIGLLAVECGQVLLEQLTFTWNSEGARIFSSGRPELPVMVNNCRFEQNTGRPDQVFSALSFLESPFTLTRSVFTENTAIKGAALHLRGSDGLIDSCYFADNYALEGWGGAMVSHGGTIELRNSVFSGNRADRNGGALSCGVGGTVAITNCQFMENSALFGGACLVGDENTRLLVDSCHFEHNQAERSGGAIASTTGTQVIVNRSTFLNNEAFQYFGGAIQTSEGDSDGTSLEVRNSIIWANKAKSFAGAIQMKSADAKFINNLFVGNTTDISEEGAGAIYFDRNANGLDSILLLNNTFAHNVGNYSSLYVGRNFALTLVLLQNNLFGDEGVNFGKQGDFTVFRSWGGNLSNDYSFGSVLKHARDQTAADPLFVHTGTDPETASFQLQPGSPAIDAGVADGAPAYDIEGRPRTGLVDSGAYEYQGTVPVNDHYEGARLQVFPNPVKDILSVRLPPEISGIRQLSILDQTGRLVGRMAPGELSEMDVRFLPAGIYLLILEIDGWRQSLPFVKE